MLIDMRKLRSGWNQNQQ